MGKPSSLEQEIIVPASSSPASPVRFKIDREIPLPYFIITHPNGDTEELEVEETREYFRMRGADMDVLEKALDYVWNFGSYKPVFLDIKNYREPAKRRYRSTPDV